MRKKKRLLFVIAVTLAVVLLGGGTLVGFLAYRLYQLDQLASMTFEDMLAHTTAGEEDARITVGVLQNDAGNFTVYGADGATLPPVAYTYEIGSITKTFTAALLMKAAGEGKVSLDDGIDAYLDLPAHAYYPTLRRLLTHTSGYKSEYFEPPMATNFFAGRNSYYRISGKRLTARVGKVRLEDRDYAFDYSNFGFSVLGEVLSAVYGEAYAPLMNAFVRDELGLRRTQIADGQGDLGGYWDWAENDAFLPAGALLSTICDMMAYAQLQLSGTPAYLSGAHTPLAEINATPRQYEPLNVRFDAMGAAWILDTENQIVWHNGGTGNFNSYLGLDIKNQRAVIILSNLPPSHRIPATMMGPKKLLSLTE